MRLQQKNKQQVHAYVWTGLEEDAYTWGERHALDAAVYPLGEGLTENLWGEIPGQRLLLLYDGAFPLAVGMGVSLDGGTPAYRITALERWSHQRATLEWIPEGRRGCGGA